jgi:oxalate decarboxylase
MEKLSLLKVLALSVLGTVAVAGAADAPTFGNPDEPSRGGVNSTPGVLSEPGPQNPALAAQLPSFQNPPATDVGDMPSSRPLLNP